MSFVVGQIYSFTTRSPAFLGTTIKNARCLIAGMDAQTARKFATIDQLYRKIYPTLPPGSVDDVNAQTYYLFQGENGSDVVLAEQWIDMNTVNVVEFQNATVYIAQTTPQILERARMALVAAGVENFQIVVQNP